MGVDAYVLLRVKKRSALREALEAHAARERSEWREQGREDAYEELLADGYDPMPLMQPLEDGAVAIFSAHRFNHSDTEYTLRVWLHDLLGGRLAEIHDDPRGVFIYPDVCEPRATTYEGTIAELEGAGRFIDARPATEEEQASRMREVEEAMNVPVDTSAELARQRAMMEMLAGGAAILEAPSDDDNDDDDDGAEYVELPAGLDISALMNPSGSGASPQALMNALAQLVGGNLAAELESITKGYDPNDFGRVSVLLPPEAARALTKSEEALSRIDVAERIALPDGSVAFVTTQLGDPTTVEWTLAEALDDVGFDRSGLGPVPFCKENALVDLAKQKDFATARAHLGDRAEARVVKTSQEASREGRERVRAWLRESD